MPVAETPALEMPSLDMPDHTVPVDLGTPWEDEAVPAASNKAVYGVLATFAVALLCFVGYTWHEGQSKPKASVSPTRSAGSGVFTVGENTLKMAQNAYNQHNWQAAQQQARTAYLVLNSPVAPPDKRKAAASFYLKATNKWGTVLYGKAQSALASAKTNEALNLAEQALHVYAELPDGSKRDQARMLAFEASVYQKLGDDVNAVASLNKAASLHPGGGYASRAASLRMAARPAPAPVQAAAPAVEAAPEPSQPAYVEPSLGDGNGGYPGGVPGGHSGGGHSGGGPAAGSDPAPAAAPARRPTNTYHAPPKDDTPSFRKRRNDGLPGY